MKGQISSIILRLICCNKDDVFSNKFKPINPAIGLIDTQCAFNDKEGLKILTSKKGELFTFDGGHLTLAGANELAQNLMSRKSLKKFWFIKFMKNYYIAISYFYRTKS